jgi:hypothetical protein
VGKIFENGTDLPKIIHFIQQFYSKSLMLAQLEVKEINSRIFKDFY